MQQQILTDQQRDSADIIIIDGLPPEEGAMSQALYSRKPKSILHLLLQVLAKGATGFMQMFYSGYGHNSIGDCGSITLYIENVSMLAAKAFQNWSLYNGQEASTRYLDFTGRIMINPLGGYMGTNYLYIPREKLNENDIKTISTEFVPHHVFTTTSTDGEVGKMIQESWMAFYEKHMPIVKKYVSELNPLPDGADKTQYEKSVNARAFDIMRGVIPAGMTTLLSWHSNIRQIRDHLAVLKYHPSYEVARVANTTLDGLHSTYPSSFTGKTYPETEAYLELRSLKTSYYEPRGINFQINDSLLDKAMLELEYRELLVNRPAKTELPPEIGEAGVVRVIFNIDFGSYRDAQRHRKGSSKMPLLTTMLGFHPWYLERLPEQSRIELIQLMDKLIPLIESLDCSDVDRQYYIPMGFMVTADFTWSFDQCVYVAELRSSETVHPTFRSHAQSIGKWIKKVAPYAAQYVDYSEDKWSYKRGNQDIVEK